MFIHPRETPIQSTKPIYRVDHAKRIKHKMRTPLFLRKEKKEWEDAPVKWDINKDEFLDVSGTGRVFRKVVLKQETTEAVAKDIPRRSMFKESIDLCVEIREVRRIKQEAKIIWKRGWIVEGRQERRIH